MNKAIQRLLFIVSLSTLGLVAIETQPVQAAKVGKVTQVKKSAYYANKGNIYTSTQLNQVKAKAKTYQNTTLYVTKHATLKQNGKKKVFYYVDTAKVKGWLWRGYLKAGKATPSVASMNPAMAKQFLNQTNKYRAAKGMKPVSLDPARMALLKQYKVWFKKSGSGYDVDNDAFRRESGKVGLPTDELFSIFVPITSKYDLKNSKNMSQDAIDTFMIVGNMQPDYKDADVLKPKTTKIGISWFEVDGKVYTMLLTNLYY